MNPFVIETRGLTKTYKGKAAVDQLDLCIPKGEIYGFLGPNGAGKTTTIRMLLGLIRPTSGSVHIFGRSLRSDRLSILRKVGSLVEYPSYYGHLNAIENLEAIRRILGAPKSRIAEVLEIVSLTKDAGRAVKGYSLGMKQRLGIAAALLGAPELLILDEPTNGLDPAGIHEVRELIKRMPEEHGITVLVSSHLLSEVEQMAGSVGIISQGRMVFQDTIQHLKEQSSGSIQLSVSEPEAALWLAKEEGFAAQAGPEGVLTLQGISDKQVAFLIRRLVENHHEVYRAEEKRKSLEDIFMQIVGTGGSL